MAMETKTKPSYLGTLNAISLAEAGAGVYLKAWADATRDEDLACCLNLVAARETSHGDVFCRRISELGFELIQKPDPGAAERIARYANPQLSDKDKIGPAYSSNADKDPFEKIEQDLANGIYDPLTAKLMTWYIGEERDSGKMLREAYAAARAKCEATMGNTNGSNGRMAPQASSVAGDTQALMECMTSGFDRLERALEKLASR
jgi:hypothetical protein